MEETWITPYLEFTCRLSCWAFSFSYSIYRWWFCYRSWCLEHSFTRCNTSHTGNTAISQRFAYIVLSCKNKTTAFIRHLPPSVFSLVANESRIMELLFWIFLIIRLVSTTAGKLCFHIRFKHAYPWKEVHKVKTVKILQNRDFLVRRKLLIIDILKLMASNWLRKVNFMSVLSQLI